MHFICTDLHIKAEHYAAALGLPQSAWKSITGVDAVHGRKGNWHILPQAPQDLAVEARRSAAKGYHLHDLSGVV